MPSNDKDSISNLVSVFSALNKIKDEPRGVSSHTSVIKDNEDRVDPNLKSTEVERLKKIATVFGQTLKIGEYAPKPEARRLQDLTPDKQKVLGISAISDKVNAIQSAKKDGSLMDLLPGLLGLLGLGRITDLVKKALSWLTGKLGLIFKGVGNIIQQALNTLWKPIKAVTQKLWDSVKWVGSKIWSAIRWLGSKLSVWVSKIVTSIKGSKFYTGFMKQVGKITSSLKTVWDDIINSIKGFIDNILENIVKVKDAAFKVLEKVPGYKLLAKTGKTLSRVAGNTVDVATRGITNAGGVLSESVEQLIGVGKGKIGSFIGKLFKGGAGKIGSFFKSVPILSSIIEGLFAANDIKNLKESYTNNQITLDDLKLKAGKRTIKAITGVGGAALGAAALSVIPGVGTLIGGVGGDILGRYLGDLLVDKIMSPDITKKLGSYVTNTGEMQDFFVRDKKVFSFSSKDEVLGIKTGGAIDNFLKSQNDSGMVENVISHNKFTKTALIEQIKRQDTMIELLTALTRKTFGNVINQQPQQSSHSFGENFRDAYNSQTLAIN